MWAYCRLVSPQQRPLVRAMSTEDWGQVWPFWREIVEAGETYAYPLGATSEEAQAL